jgi:hypothetical protein
MLHSAIAFSWSVLNQTSGSEAFSVTLVPEQLAEDVKQGI